MSEINGNTLTGNRRMDRFRLYWAQYLFAFMFPFIVVYSSFAVFGCYPFGSRSMLTVDLYHQYAPFLVELRNKIVAGKSLFFSHNDGLGTEFYAAFANYSASPLNIFCVFFNAKNMPVFIAFITAVRGGLASLFMMMFLSAHDNGRLDNISVVFASSYALCGWFVTDFWNIMWCDALVLLPLVALGLRRLFLEKKWGLYIGALAVTVTSNFYAGFFICLFMVIFAPCYFVMTSAKFSFKNLLACAGRFALGSAVGGGISAFITLPVYMILQNASATGDEFPKNYELTGNLFDFLGRLMVAANPNIRDGMANVSVGLVVTLMIPLFFMLPASTGIKLRHKICFGILVTIMYLSFTNRTLNFIWHGFHFPNQIPYRESFIMSFLLVFMGFLTIRRLRSLPPQAIPGALGAAFLFLVLFEKFGEGNEGYIQIGTTLLFLIVQGIALSVISKDRRRSAFFCETLLTVTMCVELMASSMTSIGLVWRHEGFVSYDFFGKNHEKIHDYITEIEGKEGHKSFERSELYPNNICNIQSLYDIKGMSIFSSTARESFVKYMANYGFHNNGINGLRNSGLTRVTASLLGVRNLVEIKDTKTVPVIFDTEYKDPDGEVVYHANKDALALGYMVDNKIMDYTPDPNNKDVFEKTNKWLNSMGVEGDVYKPVTAKETEMTNLSVDKDTGSHMKFTVADSEEKSSYTLEITEATEGADVYIYADCSKGGNVSLTNGDISREFEIRSLQTICLGKFTGKPITVKVDYSTSPSGSFQLSAYELDNEVYAGMLAKLGDEELNVTSYDETNVKGEIDALSDGTLFITMPYSEGWTAKVDGEEREIKGIGDALIGIPLSAGHHTVELRYVPRFFGYGVAGSLACVALAAAIIFLPKLKKKKAVPAPVEVAAEEILNEEIITEEVAVNDNAEI